MAIHIKKEVDVHVTEDEFRRYSDEYQRAYMYYCGTPPSLESFIRARKREKSREES